MSCIYIHEIVLVVNFNSCGCFSSTKNQKDCLRSGIPLKFEILSVQVFTHPFLGIQMSLLVLSARLSLPLRVQKLNRCERLNHPSGSKWDIYKWYKCTCQCWRWTCHSILCPYISVSPQGVKEGMYTVVDQDVRDKLGLKGCKP